MKNNTMTKSQKVTYYILLVLTSLMFLFAGASKLSGNPMAAAGFAQIGLPVWFMYTIGIGEVLGAIGLWVDCVFRYSYEGLFLILAGAIVTTAVFTGAAMAIFPLVTAILLGIVVRLHGKKTS